MRNLTQRPGFGRVPPASSRKRGVSEEGGQQSGQPRNLWRQKSRILVRNSTERILRYPRLREEKASRRAIHFRPEATFPGRRRYRVRTTANILRNLRAIRRRQEQSKSKDERIAIGVSAAPLLKKHLPRVSLESAQKVYTH